MTDDAVLTALNAYLSEARWFSGKGREFTIGRVRRLAKVPGTGTGPGADGETFVHLVTVEYADGEPSETEIYQVPLSFYRDPQSRLDHAFVGWWEDDQLGWVHAYDATHDRETMSAWLRAFADPEVATEDQASGAALVFHRVPGHELDLDAMPSLFSGEQSNSSVHFGEDAVLKVFRKVTSGDNPDITIHDVLTRSGSGHVAPLYGWISSGDLQLAMLQKFLRTATDGWELALASVRNLFNEADLMAEEVGGDFAGESARLGEALREVHEELAASLGTSTVSAARVRAAMEGRLDEAMTVVPELAEHEASLRGAFRHLEDFGEIEAQRIHGDLHLGQTLRTVLGWKLVDFEGEPAKPLAERVRPDSVWRDVAGMMRSFDYAPHAVERSFFQHDQAEAAQRAWRAEEWAARNKAAFLAAYAGELSAAQGALLSAYVADKAVYECVYEARNRPSWLPIPLAAIAKVGAP